MSDVSGFQREVADLIVTTLNLDVRPEDIKPGDQLFGDGGLGLDSIDALELALAIQQKYAVEIRSDDEEATASFASVQSLSEYIGRHRKG
ncbi:MAG: phosphopantetheine-binding protein [Alphaproteobacteria bacterium]